MAFLVVVALFHYNASAQHFYQKNRAAKKWVRAAFKAMSNEDKIAQLMVVRAHSNLGPDHVAAVTTLIQQYHVGGLCFFQGGPVRQAQLTNYYQSLSSTPLMICMDAEWGLGMRLDSVINYPHQIMMGATQDPHLSFLLGQYIGQQCKRMGVQVNYAPVVDVNNNPNNPVINDRSFGENKRLVASYGLGYMQGMQQENVMACAKHFPGHGDVAVDSHLDLPIINKSIPQLDTMEIMPFRTLINAGVGSVMTAHLFLPAIDSTAHLAGSLSPKNINGLLKKSLGFKGIVFTDALEMKGITNYFPAGEAAAQALIAGNDMLCLPGDVAEAIQKVKDAIAQKTLTWRSIDRKVKKVLLAKYQLGLPTRQNIDTNHLVDDLNIHTQAFKQQIANESITLIQPNTTHPNLPISSGEKVAYVAIGTSSANDISQPLSASTNCDTYYFNGSNLSASSIKETIEPEPGKKITDSKENLLLAQQIITAIKTKPYQTVVIGMHQYNRRPANNFSISPTSLFLLEQLSLLPNAITVFFGNPYALKFANTSSTIIACYEDDAFTQKAAAELLLGNRKAKGKLPVTVSESLKVGMGADE